MEQIAPLEMPARNSAAANVGVHATPSDYEIRSELPKMTADDITVRFVKGVLTVSARIETEIFHNLSKVLIVDRQSGCIEQGFALPPDADPQNICADFTNGVLKVVIGRLPPAG